MIEKYIESLHKPALLLAGLSLLALTSCNDDEASPVVPELEGTTNLMIDARFGDSDFELNKAFRATSGDQSLDYEFTRLRYWVSNVILVKESGEEFILPNSYYLMEETGEIPVQDGTFGKVYPANKREEIELSGIPAGDYKSVKFNIGVEPKYNDNLTLQIGELTPLNGMAKDSWMWFTSYIFTSAAGKMSLASDAGQTQNFFLETGSNEMYIQKSVNFEQPIRISSTTSSSIELILDMQKVVNIENAWDNAVIGATDVEMMTKLRDNYVDAVSLNTATSSLR
ncbi:hypothetical protein J2X69_003805 [Algoriphagus sp. 4150]|uniref:MbnP family protein n=1 Tax=Algoriphagus sp. 4150 TaxID=2817756 RepID=UPI0028670F37|nr:MbnP family protein [Algoriphagus sp. 4150]MDR7131441.1 hypothetical protein [Algoriphagus sp. 4150]